MAVDPRIDSREGLGRSERPDDSTTGARGRGRPLLALAALAAVVALQLVVATFRIGDVPLLEPDEPRYALAARGMLESGDYLVPMLNDQPRINKPPLVYWLVAASMSIPALDDDVAARLPSIAFGALLVASVFLAALRARGLRVAIAGALVLATMPLVVAMSRACTTDMVFAALFGLTLLPLWLAREARMRPRAALVCATLAFGLALLAKATAALAVPVVLLLDAALDAPQESRRRLGRCFVGLLACALGLSLAGSALAEYGPHGIARDAGAVVRQVAVAIGLLSFAPLIAAARAARSPFWAALPWRRALAVALVPGLAWYAAIGAHVGPERFTDLVRFEVFGRLAGADHGESMLFLLPLAVALSLPWSLWLIPGRLTRGSAAAPDANGVAGGPSRDRFLVAWIGGVLLFFSIPAAKRSTYLLPALAPLSIFIARTLLDAGAAARTPGAIARLPARLVQAVALSVCAAAPVMLAFGPAAFGPSAAAGTLLLGSGMFAAGALVRAGRPGLAVAASAAGIVAGVLLAAQDALPMLMRRSNEELARSILPGLTPGERVFCLGLRSAGLSFYLERPVLDLSDVSDRSGAPESAESSTPSRSGTPDVDEDASVRALLLATLAQPGRTAVLVSRGAFERWIAVGSSHAAGASAESRAALPAGVRMAALPGDKAYLVTKGVGG